MTPTPHDPLKVSDPKKHKVPGEFEGIWWFELGKGDAWWKTLVWAGILLAYVVGCLFSISLAQIAGFLGLGVWLSWQILGKLEWKPQWPLLRPFMSYFFFYILAVVVFEKIPDYSHYLKKVLEPLILYWAVNSLVNFEGLIAKFNRIGLMRPLQENQERSRLTALVFWVIIIATAGAGLQGCIQTIILDGGVFQLDENRPTGNLDNPITYSNVIMIVCIVATSYLIFSPKGQYKVLPFILFFLFVMVIARTREAWVGYFVGVMILCGMRNRKWMLAPVALFLAMYFLAPASVQSRVTSILTMKEPGVMHRLEMWEASLPVIADHFWFGCGMTCGHKLKELYPEARIFQQYFHVHQSYIQIWINMGIFGLLAWLSIWFCYFRRMLRTFQPQYSGEMPAWFRYGVFVAVISFLVSCLFENHYNDQEVIMLLYFLMGFSLAGKSIPAR